MKARGFTIVELLIVIVVIAILAVITVVAYNGITSRAQDSQRLNDVRNIAIALEQYKSQYSSYPAHAFSGLGSQDGWEASAREANGQFIAPLVTNNYLTKVPVDPVNNATQATMAEVRSSGGASYYYHRYVAPYPNCDPARGSFYILAFGPKSASDPNHPNNPGFSCPSGRNWSLEFKWVKGGYEND